MSHNEHGKTWWTRECGGRDVLAIALPLVVSTGSFAVTLFVDRMFLLWHSATEMAAAMPAGMLHWTMICFPLGVAAYANTFVAQYHGAKRPAKIGLVTWQAMRVGFYCTPLFLCTIPLAPFVFAAAGHEPLLRAHEVLYFQVLTFGAGAGVMAEALSAFFTGRGVTRTVMYVNVVAMLINLVLDYCWIFGNGGFPEMGIEGAAWATVVSQWFKVTAFLFLFWRPANQRQFQVVAGRRPEFGLLRRMLLFGSPNGMQYLIECGAFALVTLNMGQYGKLAMAATTLAFNVNAVAFIPMIGIGIAVSTLVGQQLTRERPDLARRATWTAACLATLYTGVFAFLYLAAPDLLMMGHAAGVDAEDFTGIRDLTVVLLRFVAAYCFFDALQIVFVGAIKGAGDTWFVLGNTSVVSCCAVMTGWIGAKYFDGGLLWWWFIVAAWVCMLGVTYFARFLQGYWEEMRVIETEAADSLVPTDAT